MKRLLFTAALVAAVAPTADAQLLGSANFGTLCSELSSGTLVCASGSAELYTGVLKVSVQNVQGPAGDLVTNGTEHRIMSFGLYYDGVSMGPSGEFASATAGSWSDGPNSALENPGPAGGGWTWLLGAQAPGSGGMHGCDAVGGPATVSSCDGPIVFTFSNIDEQLVDMSRLNFAFRSQSVPEAPGSIKCYATNAAGTDHSCLPLTTTPEPGTVVLLASGILGLGGFGLARRRREGKV